MSFFGRYGKFNDIKNEIHWFFQRGRKGYCDKDIWELNTWFAETFSRMLMELSEKTISYPHGFGDKDYEEIIENGINSQAVSEDRGEDEYHKWKAAIKEAAEQFAATGGYSYRAPTDEQKENRDKAFEFVRKYFYDLWW